MVCQELSSTPLQNLYRRDFCGWKSICWIPGYNVENLRGISIFFFIEMQQIIYVKANLWLLEIGGSHTHFPK